MYREYHKKLVDMEVIPYKTFKEKLRLTNKYKNHKNFNYKVEDLDGILLISRITLDC